MQTKSFPMDIVQPPDPADERAYADWLVRVHEWWDEDESDSGELDYVDHDGTVYPITPDRPFGHPDRLASPDRAFTEPGHRLSFASPNQPFPKHGTGKGNRGSYSTEPLCTKELDARSGAATVQRQLRAMRCPDSGCDHTARIWG
jgi:hypothetical protein